MAQSSFDLTHSTIKLAGETEEIIFTNLVVSQSLSNVCSFSFTWQADDKAGAFDTHLSFLTGHLGKELEISIREDFIFKGIISEIQARSDNEGNLDYDISGNGLAQRHNEVPQCKSFLDKDLSAMFNTLNGAKGPKLSLKPNFSKQLPYTVQYNQTTFSFFCMMAARHGEWLYYNGSELVLGPPAGDAIPLIIGEDLHRVQLGAAMRQPVTSVAAFDHTKGELINKTGKPSARTDNLVKAGADAGAEAYGSTQLMVHAPHAVTADMINAHTDVAQKETYAGTVQLSAYSHNSKLNLGALLKVQDGRGNDIGQFVITAISHAAADADNYENYFVAAPDSIEVPPTAAFAAYQSIQPQVAKLVDNVDDKGMDRASVHFPWQEKEDNTPFIPVLTPHAGKDKGFRFLPEKGDEVLIDFINGNPELPFIMGAVHTEANKSGYDPKDNNLKVFGTRTGRRLEIDDEEGLVKLYDNYVGKYPINAVMLERSKERNIVIISSRENKEQRSHISLVGKAGIGIQLTESNKNIVYIDLDRDGKSITIHSDNSINISSGEVNIKGQKISIDATDELSLKGGNKVLIDGLKIEAVADTDVEVSAGVNLKLSGGAQADLSGGAMINIAGGLVKIN